jgi:excisionase family DNA binding protein
MNHVETVREPLWDARDVATYLKASRSWVYLHAEDGTLPCVRIGGLLRFLPDQIRAFARGEAIPSPSVVAIPGRGR